MPAGSTYTPIATTTLGSSSATVTFSSIPSTYTDLVIVFNGANTAGLNKFIQFNNDTSSLYSCTALGGDGTSASSSRFTVAAYIDVFNSGTNRSMIIVQVQNYSNTTTFKTYLSRNSAASNGVEAIVGMYRSTAAINRIDLKVTANAYAAGSTFTLYGIAAA
jgi:hypothetical protein